MAKKKTAKDYASDISELHYKLQADPDSADLKRKLAYRIGKWESLLNVFVEVAGNEQKPWSSENIGYPTTSMKTKKDTDHNQVGDYVAIIKTDNDDKYIGLVVERKSIEDLYGTLVDEDNRERFYREIDRYQADERFDKMFVIVEGSFADFIMYQPSFEGGEFTYTRRFDTKKNRIINDKKLTVLADLFIMGIPVIFADNSTLSAQMCGRFIRESVRKGYADVLGL